MCICRWDRGKERTVTATDKRVEPRDEFHKANKNPLGEWAVTRVLIQPAAARAFGGVYVHCEPEALGLRREPDLPVIFCCTHTGWWDGYMAGFLNRVIFKRDSFLMMEEVNLARYPFFTWIGVYGVDRDDPRKAMASIEYTVQLLTGKPNRAVWMFPQGTITHPDTRPLRVFGGVGHIARRVGRCAIVPVALRYELRMDQAPDAFARAGKPFIVDPNVERVTSKEFTERLDRAMSENDDRLREDLIKSEMYNDRLPGYRRIMAGRGSANRLWDAVVKVAGGARNALRGR
jgi:chlorobactene lauroyltransferase